MCAPAHFFRGRGGLHGQVERWIDESMMDRWEGSSGVEEVGREMMPRANGRREACSVMVRRQRRTEREDGRRVLENARVEGRRVKCDASASLCA